MMRIYFAGPLFSEAERSFNLRLTTALEAAGYEVYLPQRDGATNGSLPSGATPVREYHRAIFEKDRDGVLAADVFLFVLDGRVPDEGACVELGLAYAQRYLTGRSKLIVGLHTDSRGSFPASKLNPMLGVALDQVVEDTGTLLGVLDRYVASPLAFGRERGGYPGAEG